MKKRNAKDLLDTMHALRNVHLLVCALTAIVLMSLILGDMTTDELANVFVLSSPVWMLQVIYETAYRISKAIYQAAK